MAALVAVMEAPALIQFVSLRFALYYNWFVCPAMALHVRAITFPDREIFWNTGGVEGATVAGATESTTSSTSAS